MFSVYRWVYHVSTLSDTTAETLKRIGMNKTIADAEAAKMMNIYGYLQLIGIPFSVIYGYTIDKLSHKYSNLLSLTISFGFASGKWSNPIKSEYTETSRYIIIQAIGILISVLLLIDNQGVYYFILAITDFYRVSTFASFITFIVILLPNRHIGRLIGLAMVSSKSLIIKH